MNVLHTDNYSIPYSIIVKPQCKFIRLRFDHKGFFILSIPSHRCANQARQFLISKNSWLIRLWSEYQTFIKSPLYPRIENNGSIPFLGKTLTLKIIENGDFVSIKRMNDSLLLGLTLQDADMKANLIVLWLRHQAETYLKNMTQQLSSQMRITLNSLQISDQKTAWGVCRKCLDVSLNWRLMFLPESLIRHIIIHELTHTIQPNHSREFWRQVGKWDPNYTQNRQTLKSYRWLLSFGHNILHCHPSPRKLVNAQTGHDDYRT